MNQHRPSPYDTIFDLRNPIQPDAVRDARRRLRLAETALRLKKLQAVRRLVESATSADYWVSIVNDRLDRFRTDPSIYATTNYFDRRAGRNVPLFQSERELGLLRMQGRILCATNSYAIGLIEGLTSYVIGTGYTYRAASRHQERAAPPELLAAVQDILDDFQERNEWYGGEQPGFEEELFWRSVEDGEFIVCSTRNLEGDTDVRTVEPDQLTQMPGSNFEEYSFGIRTEPDDVQRPLAYWIFFGLNPADGDEYSPDQITHFRRNAKRSIKRGLTDFCFDTLDALSLASKLRRNMSLGAAIQACYAGIRQHETATQGEVEGMQDLMSDYTQTNPLSGRTEHVQKHEPGMVDIPKGMTFAQPPTATNAAAHVEILSACLRGAGVRWNAPEWLASADASNNNYASSLTAESPFVKTVERRQNGYQETFKRLHWIAVENKVRARGELRVRKPVPSSTGEPTGSYTEESYSWEQVRRLVDIQVEAPSPETRDKFQEAQTNQIYVTTGVKSPQTVQQELGLDPEEEAVNQEEWRERTGGQGQALGLPGAGSQLPIAGGLPEGLQESLAEDELSECGGEGGNPGPCPDKAKATGSGGDQGKPAAAPTGAAAPTPPSRAAVAAHLQLPPGREYLVPALNSDPADSARQGQALHQAIAGNEAYQPLKDSVAKLQELAAGSGKASEKAAAFKPLAAELRQQLDASLGARADTAIAEISRETGIAPEKLGGVRQGAREMSRDLVGRVRDRFGDAVGAKRDGGDLETVRGGLRVGSDEIQRRFDDAFGPDYLRRFGKHQEKATGIIEKHLLGAARSPELRGEADWSLHHLYSPPSQKQFGRITECEETLDAAALAIPDIRQNTDFSCGCAALKAVLEFFGVSKPEEEIRRGTGTESLTGTHQEELAEYARTCGLKATVKEGMTADDLAGQLAAGRPVIALVYAHGTGHYVVVCGLAGDSVNLQDPATGPDLLPLPEFLDRWVWVGSDNQMARRVGVVIGK